jgi:hypothetical protein
LLSFPDRLGHHLHSPNNLAALFHGNQQEILKSKSYSNLEVTDKESLARGVSYRKATARRHETMDFIVLC